MSSQGNHFLGACVIDPLVIRMPGTNTGLTM